MPFTFSHPALVLPATYLPKKVYSLTGLVIGSMTPDFEYFIRMDSHGHYGHTLSGLFWFDLPLGILITIAYHIIVRDSLIDHLPGKIRSRFIDVRGFDWLKHIRKNWLVVIISVLVGAASHLFWDSFTHFDGYFVGVLPFLSHEVPLFGRQFLICRIFQHVSTLIGAIIIAYNIYRMPEQKVPAQNTRSPYWIISISVAMAVIALRIATGLNVHSHNILIVNCMSGGLIGLLITPMVISLWKVSAKKYLV